MGSTLLGGGMVPPQLAMATNWHRLQEGESEESSFTSPSLNEVEEYMYMIEGGSGAHGNQYMDALSYQRLPNLLEQPMHSINKYSSLNTPSNTITKNLYYSKHEEAQSSITKDTYFFNALDSKAFQYPLDFHDSKANSTIAPPPFIRQVIDQTFHIDNAQVCLKSDYALLHDPPLAPSPSSSLVSEDSYSKHLLADYEARQATEILAQHCNESLELTSHGAYYLPSTSFMTSPTLPSIISNNSSPIASLASRTSTITDTPSVDAPSLALDHCQDNHFVTGSEMISSLMSLHTSPSMNRTSKGTSVEETDKNTKKKRKRTRSRKNSEELESQRMTHIAVERNRRRQMNQHLNDLRALMPSSYIQRGDQASIVGGAIRLVEELEQVLESLHLQKQIRGGATNQQVPFSNLEGHISAPISEESYACSQSSMVNVHVEMISLSSVLVKVIAPKRHHQLLQTLQALSFLSLKVLHLKVTTSDISILYSFNLKMENDCQFQTAIELAKSIQHVFETPKVES